MSETPLIERLLQMLRVDHIKTHTGDCESSSGAACTCNAREVRQIVALLQDPAAPTTEAGVS